MEKHPQMDARNGIEKTDEKNKELHRTDSIY